MNWLSDLERKYGRFCIPNLTTILVAGQILVYAIELFVNQFITVYLGLNRFLLFSGEIWRLITFVFIPFSGGGPLSVILGIYFTWFIGTALEREWGDFKFNVYFLLGMVGTILACLVTGITADTYCLSLSLLLAFAMLYPEVQVLLFSHPGAGQIFWSVCRGALGLQLPDHQPDGKGLLPALYAQLPCVLWPAGRPERPRLGAPGAVEAQKPEIRGNFL